MGLFEKKVVKNEQDYIVYAPVSGEIVKLENVNDPVFSKKVMGDGIAIIPNSKKIYSPVSGIVSMIFPTKHAIGITKDNGLGVILHVGIETVNLKGEGFDLKVSQGQKVKAGELLMNIDLDFISSNYDSTTMIVFESEKPINITNLKEDFCQAGDSLLQLEF